MTRWWDAQVNELSACKSRNQNTVPAMMAMTKREIE